MYIQLHKNVYITNLKIASQENSHPVCFRSNSLNLPAGKRNIYICLLNKSYKFSF